MKNQKVDFKESLNALSMPYLDNLYDLLISNNIIEKPQPPQKILKQTKKSKDELESKSPARTIINQLFDLRTIMQLIYNKIGDGRSFATLLPYVQFFVEKGIVNVPLSDKRLQSLFNNFQNVSDEDFSNEWSKGLSDNKINTQQLIHQVLEYNTEEIVKNITAKDGYVILPRKDIDSEIDLVTIKSDSSKAVLFDIKFRNSTPDLKNIVLRNIERLKKFSFPVDGISKYLIIVIYTNQQEHTFTRLHGQFSKLVLEIDETLINRIFFLTVFVNKLDELQEQLSRVYETIRGLEIVFDSEDKLGNSGWTFRGTPHQTVPPFNFRSNSPYGTYLNLDLHRVSKDVALCYKLQGENKWKYNRVKMIFRPLIKGGIFIEVLAQGDSKSYFFQIMLGEESPTKHEDEYQIYLPSYSTHFWHTVTIDVEEIFKKTFGTSGLQYDRIESIRLSGKQDIVKIYFE